MHRSDPRPGRSSDPCHRRRAIPVALAAAVGSVALAAAAAVALPVDETGAAVDAVFADLDRDDSPGCALGVVRDGTLAYRRGYGMANLEHGAPITGDTVFRIGSTSKQFSALAIVLLAGDGVLSLDDEVQRWVPEIRRFDEPITIRQLLHHTSGLRDYLVLMTLAGKRDEDYYTDAELLEMLSRQRSLNFPPGSRHLYSNSGYWLLSQIVERASGESLREFAARRIFEPLGMADTHFHDDHTEIVPRRATGYAPSGHDGDAGRRFRVSVTTLEMVGDGGLFTTVDDLARWDREFYDREIAGEEGWETMLTPGVLDDGQRLDYALGLVVSDYRGLPTVSHGGSFVGYRSDMLRFPEQRTTIFVLCNLASADPSERSRRVADILLAGDFPEPPESEEEQEEEKEQEEKEQAEREHEPQPQQQDREQEPQRQRRDREQAQKGSATSADLEPYAGDYYSPELDVTYRLSVVDGALRLTRPRSLESDLAPVADHPDRFRTVEQDGRSIRFDFERAGDGAVAGIRLAAGRVQNLVLERRRPRPER